MLTPSPYARSGPVAFRRILYQIFLCRARGKIEIEKFSLPPLDALPPDMLYYLRFRTTGSEAPAENRIVESPPDLPVRYGSVHPRTGFTP